MPLRRELLLVGGLVFGPSCSSESDAPRDTGTEQGTGGQGGTQVVDFPQPCADIYAPERLVEFGLELAEADLTAMEAECELGPDGGGKVYHPATFTYQGETAQAMVRLKGNWSWRCEKKQFLISFNELEPEGRFHGLRKIVLDAPWYDPSVLGERLAFAYLERAGVEYSCVNNARLSINQQYYGVYSNVERIDKEYLQRHYPGAEADGNLYDGGVELRTNEALGDVSRRDALIAAAEARDLAAIEELVDLDQAVRLWAHTAVLPDPDSYWAGVEINYFLYDHPTRGFTWLPYDMDFAMRVGVMDAERTRVEVGTQPEIVEADPFFYQNPDWGRELLFEVVLSDPGWCERFLTELGAARAAYDVPFLTTELERFAAQLTQAVAEDPHKTFSEQDHLDTIAARKEFMSARAAFLDGWLATASCPVGRWPAVDH